MGDVDPVMSEREIAAFGRGLFGPDFRWDAGPMARSLVIEQFADRAQAAGIRRFSIVGMDTVNPNNN